MKTKMFARILAPLLMFYAAATTALAELNRYSAPCVARDGLVAVAVAIVVAGLAIAVAIAIRRRKPD